MRKQITYNIEQLQLKHKFQRNPNTNKIMIIPLSQHSFRCAPLNKQNIIEITDEEFIGLISLKKQFNEDLTQVIDYNRTIQD